MEGQEVAEEIKYIGLLILETYEAEKPSLRKYIILILVS
jgi:hypothetical protein